MNTKMTTIAMEEYELMKDSKYRMYVAAVDKALKNFEYTSEWPDLISALGKLNKVLLNYTKFPVIPRRIKISKRLAQCMHPALPSGVHLKALETYDVIFKCMGTNRLSHELFIYSAGLFPLLGHAAMNVRPFLLKVYETHFVPLGERLRPALSGFLSGVLPGLESGSDHFDRTNSLLEKVCEGVGASWFYTCIWQCVRSNSPVRLPAISYVLQHFNKKLSMEDQLYLMGNDIDVMVSGLCAGVQDSSVLVQRSALDLLLVGFPMHNTQLLYTDMVRLVTASLATILRRDMSLNRRLYSWLLGSEVNTSLLHSDHPLVKNNNASSDNKMHVDKYFELYSIDILVEAIRVILAQSCHEQNIDVKPYRLLTSLLDKPQIGPVILDTILYDVFRALYLTCLNRANIQNNANGTGRCVSFTGDLNTFKYGAPFSSKTLLTRQFISKHCQELIKNANLLFNTLEAYYIWNSLGRAYEHAVSNAAKDTCKPGHVNEIGTGRPNIIELCIVTNFLLDVIPIETYIDNTSEILPNLFIKLIKIMKDNIRVLNKFQVTQSLELCTKILNKIQPVVVKHIVKPEIDTTAAIATIDLNETQRSSMSSEHQSSEGNNTSSLLTDSSTKADSELSKSFNEKELKFGAQLEKSKSDSKINENGLGSDLNDLNRERSNSNQMFKKKHSPRIDKKSKNKKSKSSSKLYDLKKDEQSDSSSLDIPQQEKIELVLPDDAESFVLPVQTKTENKHIVKCLNAYKKFYIVFILSKILPDVNVTTVFEKLKYNVDNRTIDLESLLQKSIECKEQFKPKSHANYRKVSSVQQFNERPIHQTMDYNVAMKIASSILLEFNSFPNILEEHKDENDLPYWVKVLIICGCYPQKNNQEMQMIAINTLLEMLSLAKAQNYESINNENTKVVVMGILRNTHVNYLENCTYIIEILSQILWDFLGIVSNQSQILLCVTLLYQIHNIFENKCCVEQVIGRFLINENLTVDYFKRFTIIWHLGRDLDIKIPLTQRTVRNFDRSLLKILDNLQNNDKINIKLLSETFLVHSLLRNDISRIMNPLFTIFLNASTARISINHVHIQKSDEKLDSSSTDLQKLDDANMKKICAISSVNGNVVYHVTENATPKPQTKLKSFLFSKSQKKQAGIVNMTTSLTDNSSIVTRKNRDFKTVDEMPAMNHSNKSNVKLFINPLSSKEIYPNGVMGSYTKCDSNSNSSSESLSSTNEITQTSSESNEISKSYEESNDISMDYYELSMSNTKDDSFEGAHAQTHTHSHVKVEHRKSDPTNEKSATKYLTNYLETIEPIADGISDVSSSASKDFSGKKVEINITRLSKSHSLEEKSDHEKIDSYETTGLVHSWSYSMSDSEKISAELEISTAAEEFFKESQIIASEIMEDLLDKVYHIKEEKRVENENKARKKEINMKAKISDKSNKPLNIYTIHHHILLYCDVFDSNLILYAFSTLKNSILTNPRLFISCLATTGLQSSNNTDLLHLLGRHRKSIFGLGFSGDLSIEYINFYRGFMFLEILVSVCLNYARSFYPNLDNSKLTEDEINNNLKIQLASLELLDIIVKNLITLVNENAKGFSCYIGDMLAKCKLQKILLHCLLTSVRNFDSEMTFAEDILLFNHFQLYDSFKKVSEHVEAYQIQLLRLIQSLIILEHHVFAQQDPVVNPPQPCVNGESLKYTPTVLIPQQPLFLSAILSALRHQNMKHLHQNWCNMVTTCLPYIGQNLKQISLSIIHQICNNIEKIAETYKSVDMNRELASDYAITQLEALTIMCHYCLLDSQQSAVAAQSNTNAGQIFNNLLNVFLPPISLDGTACNKQNSDHYQLARKTVLGHMPRIITSVAKLWQTICTTDADFNSVFGYSKVVKQQLLEFLSPISLHHSANFLAAVAVAWYERRSPIASVRKILPEPNSSQKNLVYLISAIRVIPIDNLVQTVHMVIKSPPPTEGLTADICLDVPLLELFYCYMQNATGTQLMEAWTSLLALLRESFTLAPPAQFLVLAILHELMTKCCPLNDRKDQKDLQDVTAKLIECVSQVCGSCLEQTTWLRRNLAVKEQEDDSFTSSTITAKPGTVSDTTSTQIHSVQAQLVLSEILAPVLDICFGSQEKDKVVTILTSLMYNIVPYLRTHTSRNMSSFQACSKLLASLSSYQYTRKAWRKDVFDLLLDNNLFQMEYSSLKYWKIIIDNLMTHDNTTFRDLMSRVSLTQSGSLSIFSSREQEYEQRAQLLKRLAFVILCSETDQYAKYMPDIQEQLASSLRLSVPGVQAQVFLCFRVILLRMSPLHVTSLWPIIISEMLQVFLQIEQELSTDTEEFRTNSSWSTNTNNGLHAHGHPHWLQLQLATAKLLDLSLILPATALPQFQMYRWAFVGDDSSYSVNAQIPTFVPHVTRIATLMDQNFPDKQIETLPTKQNELLLSTNHITQLKDLHSFFKTLSLCSNRHRTDCNGTTPNDHSHSDRQADKQLTAVLEKLDKVIEMDFLDKIQR